MKRDWDLIRNVLEEIEGLPEQHFQGSIYKMGMNAPAVEQDRFRHLILLAQAGFVSGKEVFIDGPAFQQPELTWAGHELLDTIREKPMLEKIKAEAKKRAIPLTFDSVVAIGKFLIGQTMSSG